MVLLITTKMTALVTPDGAAAEFLAHGEGTMLVSHSPMETKPPEYINTWGHLVRPPEDVRCTVPPYDPAW